MNELGTTALGQVMGASVHQIGWQYLPPEARWGQTLVSAGWTPAGLCASTAAFFVSMSTGTRLRQWATVMQNQGLPDYSRGFTEARQSAIRSLRHQADGAGGGGIVGVTLEHHIHEKKFKTMAGNSYAYGADGMQRGVNTGGRDERDGVLITIQALGTAVAPTGATTRSLTTPTLRAGAST